MLYLETHHGFVLAPLLTHSGQLILCRPSVNFSFKFSRPPQLLSYISDILVECVQQYWTQICEIEIRTFLLILIAFWLSKLSRKWDLMKMCGHWFTNILGELSGECKYWTTGTIFWALFDTEYGHENFKFNYTVYFVKCFYWFHIRLVLKCTEHTFRSV